MNVIKAPKTGHSVQVGAYYDYKNVMAEVAKFQKAFECKDTDTMIRTGEKQAKIW